MVTGTANLLKQRARDLYAQAVVWDAHSGFYPDPDFDLARLELWRNAGVSYLSIDVGYDVVPWEHTVKTLAAFRSWILRHSDEFVLVATAGDIRRAKAESKMAVTFDIEGAEALAGRIEMVELYHHLGVKQMLLAYNRNNQAAGGCHDEDVGLTDFGRTIIDEMNRLGMFVDVSHCSHRTSMEAIEYSKTPVVFSHSNPRAVHDHERNIRDDQIKACAAAGGLIAATGVSRFLGTADASTDVLANHVDYLISVAGGDHVGIGLDYSFPTLAAAGSARMRANPQFWPPDKGYGQGPSVFASPSQLIDLTESLLRRGHSEEVVRGVLGENFLRLAETIWA